MSGNGPIGIVDEKDEDGVTHQVERLKIVPGRSTDLPGISGGPVIDLVTELVVAVVGACDCEKNLIYTSEIAQTAPVWPDEVRLGLDTLENTPTALRDRANGLLDIPRRPWNPDRLPPGALLWPIARRQYRSTAATARARTSRPGAAMTQPCGFGCTRHMAAWARRASSWSCASA